MGTSGADDGCDDQLYASPPTALAYGLSPVKKVEVGVLSSGNMAEGSIWEFMSSTVGFGADHDSCCKYGPASCSSTG